MQWWAEHFGISLRVDIPNLRQIRTIQSCVAMHQRHPPAEN
jgi:hypothetical protein